MVFGKPIDTVFSFKGKPLEKVQCYKYVGNVMKCVQRPLGDVFSENYKYLHDKANKALFCMNRKLRPLSPLPPGCMFKLFEVCIKPILTYGSDIWGANKSGRDMTDKLFMWFARNVLRVKATTSNIITLGECGIMPPSITCEINCILYCLRVKDLPANSIVHLAFKEQKRLDNLGFTTWYGKVKELAVKYNIDLDATYSKSEVKTKIKNSFINTWSSNLTNISQFPILRTYSQFKSQFRIEPYLLKVKNPKYRASISKLRTSSHILEIERGRYTRPKTPIELRLCHVCNVLEDEEHLLVECSLYNDDRKLLLEKISRTYPELKDMSKHGTFLFLMMLEDEESLTLLGKFIHKAFNIRGQLMLDTE